MASSITNAAPQNERGHVYSFSPLPQSEAQEQELEQEEETRHLEDEDEEEEEQPLSSISVESGATFGDSISDPYISDLVFSVSARTCEMTQDLLGLTVFFVLVFLPLYRRLGIPNEDPVPPVFVLNSMYLSNFTTGKGSLGATWDAQFTVMNTNVSSIYFRTICFTIFYKQNTEDVLSVASSYPFYLDQGEYVKLHLKFRTKEFAGNQMLAEEIGKDRDKDGFLIFGIQMNVEAIYYGETWVSDVVMNPYCENLKVQFWPSKDSGKLTNTNSNFSVPIEWKPFSFF